MQCYWAISELNVFKLVSVVVMAADSEGIKVAKVLMMEEEKLGVNEVTVEEDMVVVVEAKVARNKPCGWQESQLRTYQTGSP